MVKPELDGTKNYYQVLGIATSASQADIRKAFLDLARTQHPDKNPGKELVYKAKFQIITTAYDVLKDPDLKRVYDQIRPIQRKPVFRGTAAANRNMYKDSPKATTEPAARAYAFPRQAKTASRTSPKKTPTARKDPFQDWTPPVPGRTSSKASSSTPSSTCASGPTPNAAGQDAHARTRRSPYATQSAFYNASPSSPLRQGTAGSPSRRATASKSADQSTSTSASNNAPDWTRREQWWGQSGTAYSTFHAPASKYSPYAKDTPSATTDANRANTQASTTESKARPEPDSSETENGTSTTTSKSGYKWEKSRTAYQQKTTGSRKQPARAPIFEDLRPSNPFFTNTSRSTRLDSDRVDDFDDSDDAQDTSRPGGGRDSPISTSSSSTAEPEKLIPEESSEDDDREVHGRRFVPDTTSSATRPIATPHSRLRRSRVTTEKGNSANVESVLRTAEFEQHTTPAKASGESNQRPGLFNYDFTPPPDLSSASSQRFESQVPPSVKFNAIPELNFASLNLGDDVDGKSPFSTPPAQNSQTHPSEALKAGLRTSSGKKHPRAEQQRDPRYDGKMWQSTEPTTPSSLAEQFARTTINITTSPSSVPSNSAKVHLHTDPLGCGGYDKDAANQSQYRAPTSSSHNDVPSIFTTEEQVGINGTDEPMVPVVPSVLLTPLTSLGDFETSMTQYRTQCSVFSAYHLEWLEYEKQVLDKYSKEQTMLQQEYSAALGQYHEVLKVHVETCASHAKLVAAQQPAR